MTSMMRVSYVRRRLDRLQEPCYLLSPVVAHVDECFYRK
jgi:hypothetical protein